MRCGSSNWLFSESVTRRFRFFETGLWISVFVGNVMYSSCGPLNEGMINELSSTCHLKVDFGRFDEV